MAPPVQPRLRCAGCTGQGDRRCALRRYAPRCRRPHRQYEPPEGLSRDRKISRAADPCFSRMEKSVGADLRAARNRNQTQIALWGGCGRPRTSAPTTVTHVGISVKSSVRGEVEGLREEACAEPEVPGQVPKKERKRKMKKSTKSLVWDIVKAAAAAIIGVVSAYLTGCTTINFPADDTRPTSFNGITNMRVHQGDGRGGRSDGPQRLDRLHPAQGVR